MQTLSTSRFATPSTLLILTSSLAETHGCDSVWVSVMAPCWPSRVVSGCSLGLLGCHSRAPILYRNGDHYDFPIVDKHVYGCCYFEPFTLKRTVSQAWVAFNRVNALLKSKAFMTKHRFAKHNPACFATLRYFLTSTGFTAFS